MDVHISQMEEEVDELRESIRTASAAASEEASKRAKAEKERDLLKKERDLLKKERDTLLVQLKKLADSRAEDAKRFEEQLQEAKDNGAKISCRNKFNESTLFIVLKNQLDMFLSDEKASEELVTAMIDVLLDTFKFGYTDEVNRIHEALKAHVPDLRPLSDFTKCMGDIYDLGVGERMNKKFKDLVEEVEKRRKELDLDPLIEEFANKMKQHFMEEMEKIWNQAS